MYSHILFPTDSSDCADAVLDHAIERARTYDATLVALHAVNVCRVGYVTPASSLERAREALLENGEQVLDRVTQVAREVGVEVKTVVTGGAPTSETIRHADGWEVDLVVMGTHGRNGIDRYLIGSVAERVVRGPNAPVLTARQELPQTHEAKPPLVLWECMNLRRLARGRLGWPRLETVTRGLARRYGRDGLHIRLLKTDNQLSIPVVVDDEQFVKVTSKQDLLVHAVFITE